MYELVRLSRNERIDISDFDRPTTNMHAKSGLIVGSINLWIDVIDHFLTSPNHKPFHNNAFTN